MSGISRRLMVSYFLVTIVVVVLVEAFVLGYQVPRLVNNALLATQVRGTAENVGNQLSLNYPGGVPAGTLLGERDRHPEPGTAQTTPNDSAVIVPAITGTLSRRQNVTAVVALTGDGTIIASSIPSRYPVGQSAAKELPVGATAAIRAGLLKGVSGGPGSTPYGSVNWTLYAAHSANTPPGSGSAGTFAYLYLQAPQSTGLIDPIQAWDELGDLSGVKPLFDVSFLLLIAVLPIGVLLGLLASRGLVRRVDRLERATLAVTDGDYTVTLPPSGRDEVGRLEENFSTMTHQLNSALSAERERATSEARTAERSRIAREIHDAISQHLFGLRMIASGMLRADPDNEQVRAIERITEEALRDTQALLWELRPAGLDGGGLAPALEQICAGYRDRLGVTIDADIADVTVPEAVEHALLRVAQEACTNAVRHGDASRLAVSLARHNGHVELVIRDNGTGFDPTASHAGSGLQHIRDRVAELDGVVDIDSVLGAGAAVIVRVPAP